jgi:hypothetical protein
MKCVCVYSLAFSFNFRVKYFLSIGVQKQIIVTEIVSQTSSQIFIVSMEKAEFTYHEATLSTFTLNFLDTGLFQMYSHNTLLSAQR